MCKFITNKNLNIRADYIVMQTSLIPNSPTIFGICNNFQTEMDGQIIKYTYCDTDKIHEVIIVWIAAFLLMLLNIMIYLMLAKPHKYKN